jgi:hypothetical protein
MTSRIMYVELKSGFQDNGPAWIGKVVYSKTMRTLYFMNKAFKKTRAEYFPFGNYIDPENGDVYWISGVKKNGMDRHWAGSGKIAIDKKVLNEYLELTGQKTLDESKFIPMDIPDEYPVERINKIENRKMNRPAEGK